VLAAVFFTYTLTVTFGAVHGVEFCPQTFERRSYSFYELPVVGVQVTAVRHDDLPAAAETFLTSQKFVTPPGGGKQDWHIVVGSRGPRLQRKGDAAILVQYLDAKDSKDMHRWVQWSEDHPSLAKIFWPAVQQLARHELYVFIPDLFELTKNIAEPAKFQREVNREVAQRLAFLARRLQASGNAAEATQVLDEAAVLAPDNEEIRQIRDQSHAATPGS
jgi:hypothetical protein